MTTPFCPPDLSSRPLRTVVERPMRASAQDLYWAWTEQFDRWLAAPGTMLSQGEVNTGFYFETHHDGERHPYYGRFLRLDPPRLVELTWLSTGTQGKETVITIELTPEAGGGTLLRLTHAGFPDEASRDAHDHAWPAFLAGLDEALT